VAPSSHRPAARPEDAARRQGVWARGSEQSSCLSAPLTTPLFERADLSSQTAKVKTWSYNLWSSKGETCAIVCFDSKFWFYYLFGSNHVYRNKMDKFFINNQKKDASNSKAIGQMILKICL
jgi:hypothetical protein